MCFFNFIFILKNKKSIINKQNQKKSLFFHPSALPFLFIISGIGPMFKVTQCSGVLVRVSKLPFDLPLIPFPSTMSSSSRHNTVCLYGGRKTLKNIHKKV